MGSKLIAYECVAPSHHPSHDQPDKLTIHERRWAFCSFGALADGHEWRETGGEDLAVLLRKVGLAVTASTPEQSESRRTVSTV